MRSGIAFFKKEWKEYFRTGKLIIAGTMFLLFGLMNPAMAKLTPFIMEQFSSMDNSGMTIIIGTVDATMSWTQFFKNIPVALIVCILLFGGILINEVQKGTLIPLLTKGLSRWKVVCIKGINMILLWTAGYWLCYGITWFYTGYYWDNDIMENLIAAALFYWIFGIMILALMILFSSMASSMGGVAIGVGGVYFAMTLSGMVPKVASYLPTYLTSSSKLLAGDDPELYKYALGTALGIAIVSMVGGCLIFNKRNV